MIDLREIWEFCDELQEQLSNFFDDPITQAYGANDCDELMIRKHLKHCTKCRVA